MARITVDDKTYEIKEFNSANPIVTLKSPKRVSGEVLTVSKDCKARLSGIPDEKYRVIIRGLTETTNSDEIRINENKFYVDYSTGEIFFNQKRRHGDRPEQGK